MHFNRILFVSSALITLACAQPTGTQSKATLSQNGTKVSDAKESKKPLVVIVEEKGPKSDSVIVQFVYSSSGGNSIVPSSGTDKDKYIVDSPAQEEKKELKPNSSTKEKTKSIQSVTTNKTENGQSSESKTDTIKVPIQEAASLVPEEISSLSEKWPKYFYDAFSPILPFPELQYKRSNEMNQIKAKPNNPSTSQNGNIYLPDYVKETKETPEIAGPKLNPLSIYDREFNVPIFD